MSLKTTVVLIIIAAIVGGIVYVNPFEKEEEKGPESPLFFFVEEDRINRIGITLQGQSASFVKTGQTLQSWQFESPSGIPVSHYRWGGIPLLLSGPKSKRVLPPESSANLEQFGLDAPSITIELGLTDGRGLTLLLGDKTPDKLAHYTKQQNNPTVFLLDNTWGDLMSRLVASLPYPSWYPKKNPEDIVGLRIFKGEKQLLFEKDENGWHLSADTDIPVDLQQWELVLPLLAGPPSVTIVEQEAEDPSAFGIHETSDEIRIGFNFRSSTGLQYVEELSILIGDSAADGAGYYALPWGPAPLAQSEDPSPILLVDAQWAETLLGLADDPPIAAPADGAPAS